MRIIVIGAGKVGYTLAEHLTQEEHDVTVIDKDEDVIERGRVVDKKPLWKTVTLFDDKVRDIGANQTRRVAVTMPVYYKIRDIKVSVGNLICN